MASQSAIPIKTPAAGASLALDSLVEVLVTELVVRSEPHTGTSSTIHDTGPWIGAHLFVADGPVFADGYEWYFVYQIRDGTPPPGEPAVGAGTHQGPVHRVPPGWVAIAGRDGEQWVRPFAVECPAPPYDFFDVAGVAGQATAVHCFRSAELNFSARGTWCSSPPPFGSEILDPPWLSDLCVLQEGDGYMYYYLSPSSGLSAGTAPMSEYGFDDPRSFAIIGHFDDPAAQSCTAVPEAGDTDHLAPRDDVRLLCRTRFAITSIQEIGPRQ